MARLLRAVAAGEANRSCFWRSLMKLAVFLILFTTLPVIAQRADNLDFLSDASVFRDIHGMLPAFLRERAFTLLDERQQKIARISTAADLKARQQYVRERIWSYLGGHPDRTPLNARIVGTLDRGDYRIEKILFESRSEEHTSELQSHSFISY